MYICSFGCNIFRGIFLIMEKNILGNSLGLHEFLIVFFFFSREVILAQQFFVRKPENFGMF